MECPPASSPDCVIYDDEPIYIMQPSASAKASREKTGGVPLATAPAIALHSTSFSTLQDPITDKEKEAFGSDDVQKMLLDQGYTNGLLHALLKNLRNFQKRIWVVDNSGSMSTHDGHRIVETSRTKKKKECRIVSSTRWTEMQQTVDYHANLAAVLNAPTVFRMLNDPGRGCGPQQFAIGERGSRFINEDLAIARSTMINSAPVGATPLTQHVREIREMVKGIEPALRAQGCKMAILLATDGIPSLDDGTSDEHTREEFIDAMKSLNGLPVWIVVRLCTDDVNVVEYWSKLDRDLELCLEVLDDYCSEANEIREHNPWLNYGLPLHRMREMGFYHRVFDLLDERPLSKDELVDFCRLLFGMECMNGIPDPQENWRGFCSCISKFLAKEDKMVWNPTTKKAEPWINMKRLQKKYGRRLGGWM